MSRLPIVNSSFIEEEEENEDDEAGSVADTEATGASETNSYGSLTSVD